MKEQLETYKYRSDEIDLLSYLLSLKKNIRILVTSFLIFTGASATYALLATPIFISQAILIPAASNDVNGLSGLASQFGGLASLAGLNISGNGAEVGTALEIANSYHFLSLFIAENDMIPQIFSNYWDANTNSWNHRLDDPPTMQDAVEIFSTEILSVSTDPLSNVTTISMAWSDAKQAANWANTFVTTLNETARQRDTQEANRSILYLQKRLNETSDVDMRATIFNLIETQMQTIMLANVRDEYIFRIIDPAYPAEHESKPRKTFIVISGGLFGILFGLLLSSIKTNFEKRNM